MAKDCTRPHASRSCEDNGTDRVRENGTGHEHETQVDRDDTLSRGPSSERPELSDAAEGLTPADILQDLLPLWPGVGHTSGAEDPVIRSRFGSRQTLEHKWRRHAPEHASVSAPPPTGVGLRVYQHAPRQPRQQTPAKDSYIPCARRDILAAHRGNSSKPRAQNPSPTGGGHSSLGGGGEPLQSSCPDRLARARRDAGHAEMPHRGTTQGASHLVDPRVEPRPTGGGTGNPYDNTGKDPHEIEVDRNKSCWDTEALPSETEKVTYFWPESAAATLERGGEMWALKVAIGGKQVQALVDSGATRSFIMPSLATELALKVEDLDEEVGFKVASGEQMLVTKIIKDQVFTISNHEFQADLLLGTIPYEMILGSDWLKREGVVWDFGSQSLRIANEVTVRVLPVTAGAANSERAGAKMGEKEKLEVEKQLAEEARKLMMEDIERLDPPDIGAMVRPPAKRYKNFKNRAKKIPIKQLLKTLQQQKEGDLTNANQAMMLVAVPIPDTPEREEEGKFTCLQDGEIAHEQAVEALEPISTTQIALIGESSGPNFTKFEQWLVKEGSNCPAKILRVLCNFRNLFRDQLPPGLPPERIINHTINLMPGKLPSKGGIIRLSKDELQAQREILQQLKDANWITHTSSPFAAPAMIVSKKDDVSGKPQYRMVVNYQELNALTISPEYPLPTIQDVLDMLHGAKIFTTLDMEQGFHQIRVDPHDQYKTAFRTCMGQYEYKVMPFGLRGAPGTFQAVMNHMFFKLIGNGVIAYLDDVLVYSADEDSHVRLLDKVLRILEHHKMYPKITKCNFGVTAIEYLGYRVSSTGIMPSPTKIEAISIWPEQLTNITQVRQFLGAINYCRMFMGPAYTVMAQPLFDLLKKDVVFEWKPEHTAAVQALKQQLINYTTLQVPDPSKPFTLRTDASGFAIGAVLEQEGKPIGYLSKKLTPTEMRYAVYDQEFLAVIAALTKWRTLLLPADVTVYTDHRALQYLLKLKADKPVKGRVARWLDFLADFQNLRVRYQPGASNVVADALSRCPLFQSEAAADLINAAVPQVTATEKPTDELVLVVSQPNRGPEPVAPETDNAREHLTTTTPANGQYHRARVPVQQHLDPQPGTLRVGGAEWLQALQKCPTFGEAFNRAQEIPDEPVRVEVKGVLREFKLVGSLLLVRLQGLWRICVPDDRLCKQHVMYQAHDHPTAGHMGVRKTYDALARQYYWPGIRAYSRTYVESCPRCRSAKHVTAKRGGLLQCLSIPSRRWSHVSLDLITALPKTQSGHDAILTLVDTVSKMAHFIPTTTTVTAEGVVSLLADRLVRYHGLPQALISDRDPRFTSEVWELFCKRFLINRRLSSAWHPESDGQTERVHRTIEQVLRTYLQSDESAWEDLLPAAELAYNCTTHNSTGLTPFEVMIGENPLRASDLDVVEELQPTLSPPMTKLFQQLVDRAAAHILLAQARQKYYADQRRKDVQFAVGDKVWVSTKFMQPQGAAKFQPRFIGPFPVIARIGKVAYKLQLPDSMQQHPVFHASLLQLDKSRPAEMRQPEGWRPVVPEVPGEDPSYEVEHILDVRGEPPHEQYLVQWKGYPVEAATWEPLTNLDGCRNVLRAFRASRTRKRNQQQKEAQRNSRPSP